MPVSELIPPSIVQAVNRLIAEFAYRVDFEEGMTVSELFCPDGYYESDGRRSTGRDAINAAYAKRSALGPRTARHLFTNVRLGRINEEEYSGTSLMLLFAENGRPPLPALPLLVADVADRYRIVGDSVLLQSRTLASVFVRPGDSPVLPLGDESVDDR